MNLLCLLLGHKFWYGGFTKNLDGSMIEVEPTITNYCVQCGAEKV